MKREFIDIANVPQGWSVVYPNLLEMTLYSFSRRPLRGPALQIAVIERAFASAVCVLAAFQVEAMLQKLKKGDDDGRSTILALLKSPNQQAAARELLVLRDVLAHGHIYKTTTRLKNDGSPKNSHSKKLTGRVSNDFKSIVSRNKTKLMGFNVNPAQIGFCDAILALGVANEIYKRLEDRAGDMPMNGFTQNEGYNSEYFTDYINHLLEDLDKSHKMSVKNKLARLSKLK